MICSNICSLLEIMKTENEYSALKYDETILTSLIATTYDKYYISY